MTKKVKSQKSNSSTVSAVVFTGITDSKKAGIFLGKEILKSLDNIAPDVVIVFASSSYDYSQLLKAIKLTCKPVLLTGCSSAGEFITKTSGENSVSAIAIRSNTMKFNLAIGKNIHKSFELASKDIVDSFVGVNDLKYPYHSALVLADALAGNTDAIIDSLTQLTAGTYQFFGGGAGDDAKFSRTHVFYDTKAFNNSAVALEILSQKPVGIGVRHGWEKFSKEMRVTEVKGMKVVSINAMPALDVFQEHAMETKQKLDLSDPVPFFLHNVIGIKTANGYKLRVPLSIHKDGSISFASDIPVGTIITIMKTTAQSAAKAAKAATEDALRQIDGEEANAAIVFDCVATRLRTGQEFNIELKAVSDKLKGIDMVGCNTYGQIARVDGQFNGFHNCTAVVCVLPK